MVAKKTGQDMIEKLNFSKRKILVINRYWICKIIRKHVSLSYMLLFWDGCVGSLQLVKKQTRYYRLFVMNEVQWQWQVHTHTHYTWNFLNLKHRRLHKLLRREQGDNKIPTQIFPGLLQNKIANHGNGYL